MTARYSRRALLSLVVVLLSIHSFSAEKALGNVTGKHDAVLKDVAQTKLSAELLAKLREVYGECYDGAHGCMGIPMGCIWTFWEDKDSENPPTCSVVVSWSAKGDRNAYRITGNPENAKGYVAVGFSEDNRMGGDSVVGCYGSDNGAVVNRFKNPEKYNLGHSENPLLGIQNQKTATIDGHLFCDFDQTDHAMEGILDVKLRDTKYHILLAKGSSASAAALGSHAFGVTDIGRSIEKVDITDVGILGENPIPGAASTFCKSLLIFAGLTVTCILI